MIKKAVFVPLILIVIMALSTRFGVPGFYLGIASLLVYFAIGLSGELLLRRAFHWQKKTSAFSIPVVALQFAGMALLATSSSLSSSTLNGTSYKPAGVVDVAGVLAIGAISTGAVVISMLIVDACFFGMSKIGKGQSASSGGG